MKKVLLTAFEPYDRWQDNASWLALADLTSWYEGSSELITRRYPVDLTSLSQKLKQDLQQPVDFVVLCGQSPGSTHLRLENVALNLRTDGTELVEGGATAYTSARPLEPIAAKMRDAGIPSRVSHHAGTYLCNAALYLSQHYLLGDHRNTPSIFVHIPLTPAQVAQSNDDSASMSTPMASAALAILIESMASVQPDAV
ncbi:MAG: pyroglutamyl-peptidase I [Planctomycetota bacterium]